MVLWIDWCLAAPTRVPGTIVTLDPPPAYALATAFSGFQGPETGASIVVAELPAEAYAMLLVLFEDGPFAREKWGGQAITPTTFGRLGEGDRVPYLVGTQDFQGQPFDKWAALYQGEKTVLVTVQTPAGALSPGEAVTALASVTLGGPVPLEEQVANLPFGLVVPPPLRAVEVLAGSAVRLTVGELDRDPTGRAPLVLVASGLGAPQSPRKLDRVAEKMLAGTDLDAVVITGRERGTLAGSPSSVLRGTHRTPAGTTQPFLHVVTILPDGQTLRVLAAAEAEAWPEVEAAVLQLIASVVVPR